MFPAVIIRPTLLGAAALSFVFACGGSSDLATGSLPATSRSMPSVTVLRIPREGGLARLYRVPGLDSAAWKPAERLAAGRPTPSARTRNRVSSSCWIARTTWLQWTSIPAGYEPSSRTSATRRSAPMERCTP